MARRQSTPKAKAGDAEAAAPATLGALQTAVLEDLWGAGESSVRDVLSRLEARNVKLAYTTVLTVMMRLYSRGLLARRRDGRRDLYRAALEPAELSAALSREAVDRLLETHGGEAVVAFAARMREGDPSELARLRELLSRDDL